MMKKWFSLFHTIGKLMLYGYHIVALTVVGVMWATFGFNLFFFIPTAIVLWFHIHATNYWYRQL